MPVRTSIDTVLHWEARSAYACAPLPSISGQTRLLCLKSVALMLNDQLKLVMALSKE